MGAQAPAAARTVAITFLHQLRSLQMGIELYLFEFEVFRLRLT